MKNKIALFSDIHGNLTAFEAAIASAKDFGVTDYLILGDVIMQGHGAAEIFDLIHSLNPSVAEIFDLIHSLNPSVWVKGNWDDLLLIVLEIDEIDINEPSDVYIAKLGQNLISRMTSENIMDLKKLPLSQTKLINGLKINISHNLPEQNYGRALLPTETQKNFDKLFTSDTIDIAVYGHVHHQLMRYSSEEQLIINPGSIGFPFCKRDKLRKTGRAHYAILEIDDDGSFDVKFKQVKYDVAKEIERAKEVDFPYLELYKETLNGGITRTHDSEYLAELHQELGYKEDIINYLNG